MKDKTQEKKRPIAQGKKAVMPEGEVYDASEDYSYSDREATGRNKQMLRRNPQEFRTQRENFNK